MPISTDRYISRILPSWKTSGSIGRTTLSDTMPLNILYTPRKKTDRISWMSQNEGGRGACGVGVTMRIAISTADKRRNDFLSLFKESFDFEGKN